MKLVTLTYTISAIDNNNYYVYIADKSLEQLMLPSEVKDEINSFGVNIKNTDTYFNISQKITGKDLGELICTKILELLDATWDISYGLPYILFSGDTNKLDDIFKQRPVLIYRKLCEQDAINLKDWQESITFCRKFTFLALEANNHFSVISQDHSFVRQWLVQLYVQQSTGSTASSQSYDIDKLHASWYNIANREEILTAAKTVVDEFQIRKRLNIYIPDFIVVPVYNIRRFKKAQDILTYKFQPQFVMTLPVSAEDGMYTVLFPICESITNRNIHV